MDYEKLYKESLERARAINSGEDVDVSAGTTICEYIFPELKESENEKTKRILHSISSKISFHLHDIFTEEEFQCFDTWSNDWLEKQGQVKNSDISQHKNKTCEENDDSLTEDEKIRKGIIRNLEYLMNRAEGFVKDELKKRIAWLEKQGQTFTKKDVDDAYLTGVYDAKQELEKQGEQKSDWNEEDERIIRRIDLLLYAINESEFEDIHAWLKSLKQRIGG